MGSENWYTPKFYIDIIRAFYNGKIDLDPASSVIANEVVQADQFYTKQDNSLMLPWDAEKVYINPPYADMGLWINKILDELVDHPTQELILLCNVCTDTEWFNEIYQSSKSIAVSICFVQSRIKFWSPDPDQESTTSRFPSMFIYFGSQIERFNSYFEKVGIVINLSNINKRELLVRKKQYYFEFE